MKNEHFANKKLIWKQFVLRINIQQTHSLGGDKKNPLTNGLLSEISCGYTQYWRI